MGINSLLNEKSSLFRLHDIFIDSHAIGYVQVYRLNEFSQTTPESNQASYNQNISCSQQVEHFQKLRAAEAFPGHFITDDLTIAIEQAEQADVLMDKYFL